MGWAERATVGAGMIRVGSRVGFSVKGVRFGRTLGLGGGGGSRSSLDA